MWKVITAVIVVLHLGGHELSASQPRVPIMYEVENPEHFVGMAKAFCAPRLLPDWTIVVYEVKQAIDSVVPVVIEMAVPRSYSPSGIEYISTAVLYYKHDSLLEDQNWWSECGEYRSIIEYCEAQDAVRLFLESTGISKAIHIRYSRSHAFRYYSESGDSLQFEVRDFEGIRSNYISEFSISNPVLLDSLELFFGKWVPAQLSEFRSNVELSYAKLTRNHYIVKSFLKCGANNAFFSGGHSMRFVTAFCLPTVMSWSNFPLHSKTYNHVREWISQNVSSDCRISDDCDSGFTFTTFQCNTLPTKVYVRVCCDDGDEFVASLEAGYELEVDPLVLIHDERLLDTMTVGWPYWKPGPPIYPYY